MSPLSDNESRFQTHSQTHSQTHLEVELSENNVQQLHEKKKRGRPRKKEVDEIAAYFPEARCRRSRWNRYYLARAVGAMDEAGLLDGPAIMAGGARLPLPNVVLYALGSFEYEQIPHLAEQAIELRKQGYTAYGIADALRIVRAKQRVEAI